LLHRGLALSSSLATCRRSSPCPTGSSSSTRAASLLRSRAIGPARNA
jgi:hypothetical protein